MSQAKAKSIVANHLRKAKLNNRGIVNISAQSLEIIDKVLKEKVDKKRVKKDTDDA